MHVGGVRGTVPREICTLRVVLQLCAAVLSDSSESAVVRHERPKGIRATRCQLSHRSRRILGDTLLRESDDYVRGSTRRFYTFPLNQPLTSQRMRRALRSTIDKRPREASQFDRRDSFVDVERPRGRARDEDSRDVRDGEDIRARNGWEKYVRILARSAP